MIICPWCGTNYPTFQSSCSKCGGPLQAPQQAAEPVPITTDHFVAPPPAPRSISNRYAWRLLFSDGWAIAGFVFALLGVIFTFVGAGLTLGIVTAFVGLPFLGLGLVFFAVGIGGLAWRYSLAQKIVDVLRVGEAARGSITDVQENYSVEVNGRHPWGIGYRFQVNGQDYLSKVTTLNPLGPDLQAGNSVCVLYLPSNPQLNSIYPHP